MYDSKHNTKSVKWEIHLPTPWKKSSYTITLRSNFTYKPEILDYRQNQGWKFSVGNLDEFTLNFDTSNITNVKSLYTLLDRQLGENNKEWNDKLNHVWEMRIEPLQNHTLKAKNREFLEHFCIIPDVKQS